MKIAIVGATGFIGQHIFNEAVARQHQVTALVRNPQNLADAAGVSAKPLNLHDKAALTSALNDQDAAVYTLFVGGAASLEVAPGVQLFDTPEFPDLWKPTAKAARDLLIALRGERQLSWTYLSPSAFIEPGERTGKFRLGSEQLLVNDQGESRISNQDFAIAVIDELENPAHKQERFTVGY